MGQRCKNLDCLEIPSVDMQKSEVIALEEEE